MRVAARAPAWKKGNCSLSVRTPPLRSYTARTAIPARRASRRPTVRAARTGASPRAHDAVGGQLVRQFWLALAAVASMISDTHYWTWVALVTFQLVDHYIIRADDDSAYLRSEGYQAATSKIKLRAHAASRLRARAAHTRSCSLCVRRDRGSCRSPAPSRRAAEREERRALVELARKHVVHTRASAVKTDIDALPCARLDRRPRGIHNIVGLARAHNSRPDRRPRRLRLDQVERDARLRSRMRSTASRRCSCSGDSGAAARASRRARWRCAKRASVGIAIVFVILAITVGTAAGQHLAWHGGSTTSTCCLAWRCRRCSSSARSAASR